MPTDLFIFAHPDDEFAVLPFLELLAERKRNLTLAYLTDGGATASPRVRLMETQAVLEKWLPREHALFFGTEFHFPDGRLHQYVEKALNVLIEKVPSANRVFAPCWEGGHQDHDAALLVACAYAMHIGRAQRVWSFPLYHGKGLRGSLFRLQEPLPENGPALHVPVGRWRALRALASFRFYRSQWRTFSAFFPFALMNVLMRPYQCLQKVSRERLASRPHAGRLLYERRFKVPYSCLREAYEKLFLNPKI